MCKQKATNPFKNYISIEWLSLLVPEPLLPALLGLLATLHGTTDQHVSGRQTNIKHLKILPSQK